jgi:hypothetical protein
MRPGARRGPVPLAIARRQDNMSSRFISGVVAGILVAALGAMLASRTVSAGGEAAKGTSSGPRYRVVETEGHNLIVTDNQTNTLYFYTIDRDAKIGSDLKLRGQIDLTQVGKDVIKPSHVKLRE